MALGSPQHGKNCFLMTKITIFISFTLWQRSMSPVICQVTILCPNGSQMFTFKRTKDSVLSLAARLAATDIQLACGYMMQLTRSKNDAEKMPSVTASLCSPKCCLSRQLIRNWDSLLCTMLDYYMLLTITHIYCQWCFVFCTLVVFQYLYVDTSDLK